MKHAVRYKDCLVLLAHKVIKRQTGFVRLKCRGGSRVGSRGGEGVARGLRGGNQIISRLGGQNISFRSSINLQGY